MSDSNVNYWEMIKVNFDLFNEHGNWVNCLREWCILVASICMFFYLWYAVKEIKKAQ